MNKALLKGLIGSFTIFSLLLQTISPIMFLDQRAYAEEIVQEEVVEEEQVVEESETTPEPTPEDPAPPVEEETVTPTPEVELVSPTPEIVQETPTPEPNENSPPTDVQFSSNGEQEEDVTFTPVPEEVEDPTGEEEIDLIILKKVSAPTIDLGLVEETGSATLSTDKADYAPTDTALITGKGLNPDTEYSLRVWSNDEPATSTEVNVTSNDEGTFVYAYQLDGTYRPNYSAELKDGEGVVVASVTFTDSNLVCQNDVQGVDDESGQKDLTKMCVDDSGLPLSIFTEWNWDETGWNGANTGDACALFDNNGNGLTDFAVCGIVYDDPAVAHPDNPQLYTCNDTRVDRCAGESEITPPYNTTCDIVTESADDPFSGGDEHPFDTKAMCTIDMSEVGGGSTSQLVDVCSFPSGQPNSDPSDCIIFETGTGKLEIVKHLSPAEDTGLFNLLIDGTPYATDAGSGGSTGEIIVDTGNNGDIFQVSETAGTGTLLTNYNSSIVCKDLNGTGEIVAQSDNSGPLGVFVDAEDDIVCTITNTRINNGSITLDKVTNPSADPTSFSFNTTGFPSNTTLGLKDTDTPITWSNLPAGNYSITEGLASGWKTPSISCIDDDTKVVVGSPSGYGTGTISLGSGQNVTCTFTNTKLGKITVVKNSNFGVGTFPFTTTGGLDPSSFDITTSNVAASGMTGSKMFTNVNPGSYSVTENTPASWTKDTIECLDGQTSVGQLDGSTASFTLNPGQEIVCTYNNIGKGKLKIVKKTVGGDESFGFTVTGPTPLTPSITTVSGSGDTGFIDVTTGAYSVSETTTPQNWELTNSTCSNGTQSLTPSSFSVNAGDEVTCTFTNTRNQGSLIVNKQYDSNGDDTYDIANNASANSTGFRWGYSSTPTSNDKNFGIKEDLDTGSYDIYENNVTGYSFTGWFDNDGGGSCGRPDSKTLPANISITKDTTTEITLCNQRDTGSIKINKALDLDGNGTFESGNDEANGTNVRWSIDSSGTYTFGHKIDGLATDTYDINEDLTNEPQDFVGWFTTGSQEYSCDNPEGTRLPVNVAVSKLQLTEITLCNQRHTGTVVVHKDVQGANGEDITDTVGQFTVELDNASPRQLKDGESTTYLYVTTGSHSVSEINIPPAYILYQISNPQDGVSSNTPSLEFDVCKGCTENIYITNRLNVGSISGLKWNDKNANSIKDSGEPGVRNWRIFIDENGNETRDNNEANIQTDSNGRYVFEGLPPGEYSVCEENKNGWNRSYPETSNCQTVNLSAGEDVAQINFGNYQYGSITVCKVINDANGELITDSWNKVPNANFSIASVDNNVSGTTARGLYDSGTPTAYDTAQNSLNSKVFASSNANDASCVTYNDLPIGSYYYGEESIPQNGWEIPKYHDLFDANATSVNDLLDYSPELFDNDLTNDDNRNKNADGNIVLNSRRPNRTLVILNQYKPTTVNAYKVVCDSEEDLPNWGNRGAVIDENTAQNYVNNNPSCRLTDWRFQWGKEGAGSRSTALETRPLGGDWIRFETGSPAVINNLGEIGDRIEVREVFPNDSYVPFSGARGPQGPSVSAEMYCTGDVFHYDNWEWIKNPKPGETYHCVGFNALSKGEVEVTKYFDRNNNGQKDEGEPVLPGWEITLSNQQSLVTSDSGKVKFEDLTVGTYYLDEVLKEGWDQTAISCSTDEEENEEVFESDRREFSVLNNEFQIPQSGHSLDVMQNQTTYCEIGNYTNPLLTISKLNNATTTKTQGDLVEYTIVLNLDKEGGPAENVEVTDLPPDGFTYQGGTWQAFKNGSPISIPEPVYASPGQWQVGNMDPGDEIVLKYIAKIENEVTNGTYFDVALAKGNPVEDTTEIFALATDPGDVDPGVASNFVGTDVTLTSDTTESVSHEAEKTEEVLGASTELPATGIPTQMLNIAIMIFGIGLTLLLIGIYARRRYE